MYVEENPNKLVLHQMHFQSVTVIVYETFGLASHPCIQGFSGLKQVWELWAFEPPFPS